MHDGSDQSWVRAIEAAREYPPLQYQEVYRACVAGQIRAEKRGGGWSVRAGRSSVSRRARSAGD